MDEELRKKIEEYLQIKGREYLILIKNTYSSFMSQEQIEFLDNLLNNKFIKVEENDYKLKEIWQNENVDIPLAHGGRTFNDDTIHFYPFNYLERMEEKDKKDIINNPENMYYYLSTLCENVLIHELLHFFIRPKYTNNPNLKELNTYTTEGLVDLVTRDIQIKNNINNNYNSNYAPNVIYFRKILKNIPNYEDRMNLIFQGSIEQIFRETNSNPEEISYNDKITDLITEISTLISNSYNHSKESIARALYNTYANYDNEEEFLNSILFITERRFPKVLDDITNLIDNLNSIFTIEHM